MLFEIGMIVCQNRPQAGVIDDHVAPVSGALIDGELQGVVAIDHVGPQQSDPRILIGAVCLATVIRDRVRRAAIERDAAGGRARMSAPQLQIKFAPLQQTRVLRHQHLQHAAAFGFRPVAKFCMEDRLGRVDAKAPVAPGVAVLDAEFGPMLPREVAIAWRRETGQAILARCGDACQAEGYETGC